MDDEEGNMEDELPDEGTVHSLIPLPINRHARN